jgi:acetylornithine deacetylase
LEWAARRLSSHADLSHPINLNVGRIEGGDWASSVPAWCTIDVRVAIFPGQPIAEAKREIEQAILAASRRDPFLHNNSPEIVYNGFEAEGYVLENAEAQVAALAAAHRRVVGSEVEKTASTATTDARFFGLYAGMPALVYGPRSEFIHGFDERVDLRSLRNVTKAMVLFLANWCGLDAAPQQ